MFTFFEILAVIGAIGLYAIIAFLISGLIVFRDKFKEIFCEICINIWYGKEITLIKLKKYGNIKL